MSGLLSGMCYFFIFLYKDTFVKHQYRCRKNKSLYSFSYCDTRIKKMFCSIWSVKRQNCCSVIAGFSATQGAAPNRDPHLRLSEGILMHANSYTHSGFLKKTLLYSPLFSNAQVSYFLWMRVVWYFNRFR